MDRREDRRGNRKELTRTLIDKFAADSGYEKPKGIIAGFVSVCEFVENGEIISNLAYLLSNRGITVCVVDFKVFYPNLFDWLGGVSADKKGDGLIRLLNSDKTEIKSVARETDDKNVFLISPSPNDDIEDYFNFTVEDVGRIISALKETFDVVLVDIPNNPVLEFCVGALMHCHRGFFVASERIDAPRNIQKLFEYVLKITNNVASFRNIILSRQQGLTYDESVLTDMEIMLRGGKGSLKLHMVAKIPFNKEVQQCALDGKVYIRDGSYINQKLMRDGKSFIQEIIDIASIILEVDG